MVKSLYKKHGKTKNVKSSTTIKMDTLRRANLLFIVNKGFQRAIEFIKKNIAEIEKEIEKKYSGNSIKFDLRFNILFYGDEEDYFNSKQFYENSEQFLESIKDMDFTSNRVESSKKDDVLLSAIEYSIKKIEWDKYFAKIIVVFSEKDIAGKISKRKLDEREALNYIKELFIKNEIMGVFLAPESINFQLLATADGFDYIRFNSMENNTKNIKDEIIKLLKNGLEKYLKY